MLRRSFAILLLAGCATPSSTPVPRTDAPPVIQAENPEWAKIAEEALRGLPPEEQQKLLESERRYQLALAWFNKADFDKAKVEAQIAIQIRPENVAARRLLNDIHEIIVGGPTRLRGIGDHELQVAQVTADQSRLEIANHLLHGGRYMDAQMYKSALREFENAEFKILNLSGDPRAMNDLLPRVREWKARAKSSIRD
jgi:hypothetical protein